MKRVLIVDDQEPIREILTTVASIVGLEALLAHDGVGAIATLEHEDVDCIITDYSMPHMDGLQLVRNVREKFSRSIPILVVTGNFSSQLEKLFSSAGATAVMAKPFSIDDVSQFLLKTFELPVSENRTQTRELDRPCFRADDNRLGARSKKKACLEQN